jgi:dynein heavy chain
MIDDMLNEVNQDYYDSVRKSILDYVLKDPEEKRRIGITETYDAVKDYGAPATKAIMADNQWKSITAASREFIKNNLVICNKATLKMMSIWT